MNRPEHRHLVVFVKAPRVGRVKRRLAADIGEVPAWAFYRRTVERLLRRLAADPRWRTCIATTPDASVSRDARWPVGLARLPQGGGDLGRRMDRAMRRPPPGPVVLVGGDIPALGPGQVAAAFDALGDHEFVFGPATDGGFCLVGARRRPRFPYAFDGVRWSSRHALADTLANLGNASCALLRPLEDVDDGEDYARLRRRGPRARAGEA